MMGWIFIVGYFQSTENKKSAWNVRLPPECQNCDQGMQHKNDIDFYDCYRSNMNHVDLEANEAKVKRPGILIGSLSSLAISSI